MAQEKSYSLKNSEIFLFWFPLLVSWIFIAVESTFLNFFISHQSNSQSNLAAFNIIYSFFILAESPILMLNLMSIKFVKNRATLLKVKKFIFFFLIKINKELIDIQSDRGLLLDHTNIITKRPSRTADDEIMKQSRKDERRNVNFNPVPVYLNDRKI